MGAKPTPDAPGKTAQQDLVSLPLIPSQHLTEGA